MGAIDIAMVEMVDTVVVGISINSGKTTKGTVWVGTSTSAPETIHSITIPMKVKITTSMMTGPSMVLSAIETAWVNLFEVGNLWVPIEPSMCTPCSSVLKVCSRSI